MSEKLPIPMLTPFAFKVKGHRGDGMDRHGVWEILSLKGLGGGSGWCMIRRIATARISCPLNEVWDVPLQSIENDAQRVDWSTFLPEGEGKR